MCISRKSEEWITAGHLIMHVNVPQLENAICLYLIYITKSIVETTEKNCFVSFTATRPQLSHYITSKTTMSVLSSAYSARTHTVILMLPPC